MGLLCYGSYTRILLSCCPKAVTNKSLCGLLMLCFKTDNVIYDICDDDDTVSKLLGGGQNIPSDVVDVAKKIEFVKVVHYFEKEIIHHIDDSKKKHLILGLKDLIANDDMSSDTQLGTSISMKKSEIADMKTISFTEFLANIFLYVVRYTDNTTHRKELKQISRKKWQDYETQIDTITLYELPEVRPTISISKTVLGKKFDAVFTKISKRSLKGTSKN